MLLAEKVVHAAKVLLELVNDLILGVAITLWVRDEFLALFLADWAFLDAIPLSAVCSPRCCHCCDRNRTVDLEQTYKTETIFALIESPSDQHQRHARRYIRQMSAVYIPLFDKSQRHTHRYSTNASGTRTAI